MLEQVNFKKGIDMLKDRFGEKAFNRSFCEQLWKVVREQSGQWFIKTSESFVAERKHTNPPLVVDFREALLREASRRFESTTTMDDVLGSENDCPVFRDILSQFDQALGPERKKKLGIEKVSTAYDVVKISMMLNDSDKFRATWDMFYKIATAWVRA